MAPTPPPSAELRRAEDLAAVGRALDRLHERQRQVILLRLAEGRRHAEIGEVLGLQPAAVRMLLSRARSALTLEIERLEREDRGEG